MQTSLRRLTLVLVGLGLLAAVSAARAEDKEAKIQANLAKLSPEDRKIAEEQKFCVIEPENRLGAMGKPIKVMLKGDDGQEHPVFLCCKGCVKEAKAHPAETLAKLKEIKEKSAH